MVPIDALESVRRIRIGQQTGSSFVLAQDGRHYLITARHLLGNRTALPSIDLWLFDRWHSVDVAVVGKGHSNSFEQDYLVLACSEQVSPFALTATHGGFAISQDVYFAGYPYNAMTDCIFAQNLAYPFVKKAIVSGILHVPGIKPGLIILDGHNNEGFSGGPVLLPHVPGIPATAVGIIGGYRTELLNVDGGHELYVAANAGMIYAAPMAMALEAIALHPIGYPFHPEWDWPQSRFFPHHRGN